MLNSLFTEITAETSATVTGGANIVNFDVSGYAFGIGAGATFNGGVTANVVDSAFQSSTSSRQPKLLGYAYDFLDGLQDYPFIDTSVPTDPFITFGKPVYG